MKAVVKEKNSSSSLRDIPRPIAKNDEVIIKIKATGICATDIKIVQDQYYNPSILKQNLVLGHEGAGEIIEIGERVHDSLHIGDRVTFETIIPCLECVFCKKGHNNLCLKWKHLGMNVDGTFAEYIVIPASIVHKIPDNITFEEASFAEPLAISMFTLERLNLSLNSKCVIIGPGILGLLHLQTLLLSGVESVTMIGTRGDEERLLLSKKMGASKISYSNEISQEDAIFDVVIDTAGSPQAVAMAFDIVSGYGQIVFLGLSNIATINSINIIKKNLKITGGKGILKKHMFAAIELMCSKRINLENMITHRFSLENFDNALKMATSRAGMKIILNNH